MKHWITWMLCLIMAVSILPVALAEGNDADVPESIAKLGDAAFDPEEADMLDLSGNGETSPEGFAVSEEPHTRKSDVDRKATESGEPMTFEYKQFTAVLENGVLTVSGTGDLGSLGSLSECPWDAQRSDITELVLEEGITGVGIYWFCNCTNLKTISFPEGITYLYVAFFGCSALEKAELPESLTELRTAAFADCPSLKTVTAPGVKRVGDYAFQRTAMKSFTFSADTEYISAMAFYDGQIESYTVEEGNANYYSQDGVIYTDGGKTLYAYPPCKADKTFAIPAGVEKIGDCAFICNKYLNAIEDFCDVTEICYSAFASCIALKSVDFGDTVTTFGACVFENCYQIESVRFGSGAKTTGYRMFASCSSLREIDFGTALEEIDGLCFAWCDDLEEVTLPESVKSIGNGSFGECTALRSFTTTALTYIPFQALLNDISLTELNLNEGMETIYRYSVYGCWNLESVDVPASVTMVYDNAFDKRYTAVNVLNPLLTPYGRYGWRIQEYITIDCTRRYDEAFDVKDLVNAERAAEGLAPLVMDDELTECAMRRAAELALMFSHTRPDGSAFNSITDSRLYGENAAEFQMDAADVMDSWMHSEGHRENILTGYYTTIGVGCVEAEGRRYWIQCFGATGTATDCAQRQNAEVSECIGFAVDPFDDAPTSGGIVWVFGPEPEYSYRFAADTDKLTLEAGETAEIAVTLTGYSEIDGVRQYNAPIRYAADQLVWSVEDPSVATVENGVVTAVTDGKTTLTVRTCNGFFSADVSLRVGGPKLDTVAFADGAVSYKGETPYVVYTGKAQKPRVIVRDTDGNVMSTDSFTLTYRSNKNPGTAYVDVAANGRTVSLMFKIYLPATTETYVENSANGVRISWKAVPGAKGYVIYRRAWNLVSSGWTTFERWNNTTETEWTDTKVYAGTRYQYGVKAYFDDPMDNYNLGLVGPLKTTVRITTRELRSVTAGSKQLTVRWTGSKVFTGYQIKIATDRNFTKNVTAIKITDPGQYQTVIKGLKSGTTYYITVRSYQVFEGMPYFGEWSNVLSGKVK